MNQIQNKVALITGGTKGIGYGIAESLMKQGVHVAITSRSASSAEAVAQQMLRILKVSNKQ
jgi:3-oxoacyl-[acyl-carrier protein] reductase